MKKIALIIAFIGLGFVAAQAQNAPKKDIKKTETLAPAASNATVDAPAEVSANDAAVTEAKPSEKKANCSPEEKKSCGSASGKKSCCSKKAEAKKETPVNP